MTFKLVQITIGNVRQVVEKPISVLDYTHFLLFSTAPSSAGPRRHDDQPTFYGRHKQRSRAGI